MDKTSLKAEGRIRDKVLTHRVSNIIHRSLILLGFDKDRKYEKKEID